MIVGKIGVSVEEDLHLEVEVDPLSTLSVIIGAINFVFKVPFYFDVLPMFFADILCLRSEKSPEENEFILV